MAQCKTAATPLHQHWNHHSSTPSHRHEHGNICIKQLAYWHWWHSARLQQLQCISTGAATVPRQAINMTMITCQHIIKQLAYWHWWHSARLQQLHCISTGATTVPRQAINMTMVTWQHMYKITCVLTLMAHRKTAATALHQHWSYHSSTPSHQYDHDNMTTYV